VARSRCIVVGLGVAVAVVVVVGAVVGCMSLSFLACFGMPERSEFEATILNPTPPPPHTTE